MLSTLHTLMGELMFIESCHKFNIIIKNLIIVYMVIFYKYYNVLIN